MAEPDKMSGWLMRLLITVCYQKKKNMPIWRTEKCDEWVTVAARIQIDAKPCMIKPPEQLVNSLYSRRANCAVEIGHRAFI
ncbi:MAG: hypothetical protein AB2669_19150 [Candidatus Thiodiazotropha endolucinida]